MKNHRVGIEAPRKGAEGPASGDRGGKGGAGGRDAEREIVGNVWEMQNGAFDPLTRSSHPCILASVSTRRAGTIPSPLSSPSLKTVNVFPRSSV